MISILERQILVLPLEEQYQEMMLNFLQSNHHFDAKQDKVSVMLRVGFKYLKLCSKMISIKQLQQAAVILDFVQKAINQIYQFEEAYLWIVLKIRLIITRLQYIKELEKQPQKKPEPRLSAFGIQASKKNSVKKNNVAVEKLGFSDRIHLFCEEIIASPHCKQIEQDYYSQVEVVYFFGIQSLISQNFASAQNSNFLQNEKNRIKRQNSLKKAEMLAMRCRQSLKKQIDQLCELLSFEDKKVVEIIERKGRFLTKIYSLDLIIKGQLLSKSIKKFQDNLWKQQYEQTLFKIPNKIDRQSINTLIDQTFSPHEKTINQNRPPLKKILTIGTNCQSMQISFLKQDQKDEMVMMNEMLSTDLLGKKTISRSPSLQQKYLMEIPKQQSESEQIIPRQRTKIPTAPKSIKFSSFLKEKLEEDDRNQSRSSQKSYEQNHSLSSQSINSLSEGNEEKAHSKNYRVVSSSNFTEELDSSLSSHKKLCLQNLRNALPNIKPRTNRNNRFLSIQYRPSLLQSELKDLNPIKTSKKMISEEEQYQQAPSNYRLSFTKKTNRELPALNHIFIDRKDRRIGSCSVDSKIFKIAAARGNQPLQKREIRSKTHCQLPSKKCHITIPQQNILKKSHKAAGGLPQKTNHGCKFILPGLTLGMPIHNKKDRVRLRL